MNWITVLSLATALAVLPAGVADAAKHKRKRPKTPPAATAPTTRHYTGQLEAGGSIAFDLSGDSISNVQALLPIACANTLGATGVGGGAEPFTPDMPITLGSGEQTAVKRQHSAILLRDVDMTYKVTATRGGGQAVTGSVGLSYATSNFDVFTYTTTITTCFGSASFAARPAA
jgi:hypothetical protein